MIQKQFKKLIGLKKEEFDSFIKTKQIKVQPARLIPTLKTGDEMALTSIFLSTIKLVKEYRDVFFKEIKFPKGGKLYYFTEVSFPEIHNSRIDGLILVIKKGVISDAVFFEMKNKNNNLDKNQIEAYLNISKQIGVTKLITVSNEFVSEPTQSPVKVKPPKSISLYHFSWTYLITQGRLLLFQNDENIEDQDQVEIMRESLFYLENPISGVSGYTQMKAGWKELADNIRVQKPLSISDEYIEDAILSWYEEEKDMALLLSRKLGVEVKTSKKNKDSLKNDIKKIVKENYVNGGLLIKNAVSDVKITAEFERRTVQMAIKITPPLDKGTKARITWLGKQLENCKKKGEEAFIGLQDNIWVEADVKFAKDNLKIKLTELGSLFDLAAGREIQGFHIVLHKGFSAGFASNKKFIVLIEQMILDYYEGIIQYMTNWKRPAPKLDHSSNISEDDLTNY